MKDIDNDIEKKGYKSNDLSFINKDVISADSKEYDYNILNKRIGDAFYIEEKMADVAFYRPISKGPKGWFQKMIRRMVKFFVIPMREEQNTFNEESLISAKYMFRIIREQQKEIETLKEQLKEISGK
ncbi:MAG: hypothetical protein K5675_01290 [Lachnospiraceae bacterium]|nr:hypothetical protein [Lachnospiraceae bacterium]